MAPSDKSEYFPNPRQTANLSEREKIFRLAEELRIRDFDQLGRELADTAALASPDRILELAKAIKGQLCR